MSRLPHRFVCLIAWLSMVSFAQAYPDRPVRLIVPFAAGGGTDAMTRILADRLQQRLGPRFLVENVAGAGGNAGADRASHAQPDGYTLLIGSMGILTVNPWIYASTGTAILDRLVPVSMIFDTGHIFVVNPALKAARSDRFGERAREIRFGQASGGHDKAALELSTQCADSCRGRIPAAHGHVLDGIDGAAGHAAGNHRCAWSRACRNRSRTGDKGEDRGARRQYSGKHPSGNRRDHCA